VCVIDQSQNGRVISPGYTDDPSGSLQQDQPPAHVIGDNIQVSILLLNAFCNSDWQKLTKKYVNYLQPKFKASLLTDFLKL